MFAYSAWFMSAHNSTFFATNSYFFHLCTIQISSAVDYALLYMITHTQKFNHTSGYRLRSKRKLTMLPINALGKA